MKPVLVPVFCLLFCSNLLLSQDLSTNIRFDVSKEFELGKKTSLKLRQQFQINPELKSLDRIDLDDLFNEIDLFPNILTNDDDDDDDDSDDDDKDDDDDDDDNNTDTNSEGSSSGSANNDPLFDDLNDSRLKLVVDWRTAFSVDFDYKLSSMLTLGNSYSALLSDDLKIRHLIGTDLTFRPKLRVKKLKIPQRIAVQVSARERKNKMELDHTISARSGLEWRFKKKHELFSYFSVNGAIEEQQWDWDRFRWDIGIEYKLTSHQSVDFGYRFQQRLNRKKQVSHGLSMRYRLSF